MLNLVFGAAACRAAVPPVTTYQPTYRAAHFAPANYLFFIFHYVPSTTYPLVNLLVTLLVTSKKLGKEYENPRGET